MVAQLAGISGKVAMVKLTKIGYRVVRQRGSHVRLHHPQPTLHQPVTIPLHHELKIGLLHQIIKDAGLTVEQFLDL